jgi:hypothetical protein
VQIGDTRYPALPSDGPAPRAPVTGPLKDVADLDTAGTACGVLPGGSLSGAIALILRGGCTFETKLNNAQTAGAAGAIVYSDHRDPFNMQIGAATLPSMMITNQDGLDIKAKLAVGAMQAALDFTPSPIPKPANRIAGFSSIGPGPGYLIKPDLVAICESVYHAASGEVPGDKREYGIGDGTSISSPIVAGAAAVLQGARPRLTPSQQLSLLTNTADLLTDDGGNPLSVMSQGAGRLNLAAALTTNVAATPTSVSFGANPTGAVERKVLITNVGRYPETYSVSAEPFSPPRAPFVSPTTLELAAGQSEWVTVTFDSTAVGPGVYEGVLQLRGSRPGARIHLPYWMGVSDGTPHVFSKFSRDSEEGYEPDTMRTLFTRVNDRYGIGLTDPLPNVHVQSGDGAIEKVYVHPGAPEAVAIDFRIGSEPGWHCLNISIAGLATTECIYIYEQ